VALSQGETILSVIIIPCSVAKDSIPSLIVVVLANT